MSELDNFYLFTYAFSIILVTDTYYWWNKTCLSAAFNTAHNISYFCVIHTYINTYTKPYTHAYIHTHTYTHIYTHIYTYTHTGMQMEGRKCFIFNDALNTFYLRLYGVEHMVKDHSYSERRNPLPPHGLLFPFNSKNFIYIYIYIYIYMRV